MTDEFNALLEKKMWVLVLCISNMNLVGSKWVYYIKYNSNGSIAWYKARLVAQGFRQKPDIDYHETFSLVVCATIVRIILSLVVSFSWQILQLDVKNAFLHGSLNGLLDQFISRLSYQFAMKDLGNLHYFLGIQVVRSSHGLHLSQQKYISDLLLKFHMHTCKPICTPLASRTSISLLDGELLSDPSEYRSMVGALQYLTMTRPNIFFAVNVVSQFMHVTHMHCINCIFRYLKGTLTYGLTLRASSPTSMVIAYFDVDWVGCPDSRRSTSGCAMFLGSNLISWHAKKQLTVSKSSTEAGYRAVAYTITETCWICHILCKLGIFFREPIRVLCDNINSTYMTRNPVFHDRSKHIVVDFHFVRDKIAQGDLIVQYVPTQLQLADIFHKGPAFISLLFSTRQSVHTSASPD
ncbi:uncharacterized mitochondrial protein AtMg00810-like [Solanum verrucosum]|uniref:uncharacterized mitochondrial protein AtMg00810-like n=1 Tax=Solanum verrucosum TaxID=315347 RepID=UPI0020D05DFA|nr:uncharacterized mitochondrial protein AtMg00810-like [Solanum verrucosum]